MRPWLAAEKWQRDVAAAQAALSAAEARASSLQTEVQRLRVAASQEAAVREAALAVALAAQERELDDKHAKEVVGLRAQVRLGGTGSYLTGHPV